MNEDIDNLQYSLVYEYNYPLFFQEIAYNGKTLSEIERREFVSMLDNLITQYSEGLPLMHETLKQNKELDDEYHILERAIVSISLFVLITMIDCLVASKYFISVGKDYDRRFMRGKLRVILNEGFKQLYGFTEKAHKESEWGRLSLLISAHFPDSIKRQYNDLTVLLEKHAISSSWWKSERNAETHLITEKLYASRQEEIIESKVMMDTMKLFNTLLAVNHFLSNAHACMLNYLIVKYRRGELKD
jgi:hypothetical protein